MLRCIPRHVLIASLAVLPLASGHGQVNPFYELEGNSLNSADFSMLFDAANGLLLRSPLPNGTMTSWANSQTGSKGTIQVTATFHREGMLCHKLRYETHPQGVPQSNNIVLNWCKTRDGAWKILS